MGAAILDDFGRFVGLCLAGNDYTDSGYFTATKELALWHQTDRWPTREGWSWIPVHEQDELELRIYKNVLLSEAAFILRMSSDVGICERS